MRDTDRRKREEEQRRMEAEMKKSPPKSPEDRPDGARSPEQISEREAASHSQSMPSGKFFSRFPQKMHDLRQSVCLFLHFF